MSLSEQDLVEIEKRAVLLEAGLTAHARVDLLALVAEVRRLSAALAHYADEEMWGVPPVLPEGTPRDWYLGKDNGWDVARAALGGGTDRRAGE